MSVTENYQRKDEDAIEVSVADIIGFFRDNRRRILVGALIGLFLGALYAFSKPNVYTAQVSVMPEIQAKGSGSLGGLGSLAGLAGINIDNLSGQDAIRPDLYPNVLQSIPFALYLLKQPVSSAKLKKQLPLSAYMDETGKSWLGTLFATDKADEQSVKLPVNPQLIELTKEQNDNIKGVLATVTGTYDKKTGILTISATEPEAVIAATTAQNSLNYLTNYITTYRTEKSRRQVEFLRRQTAEAKSRYQAAEYALSNYRDSNRAIYLNTAKLEEQRLQADYLLTQSVYNELSKQLEQAKIKVQEETPVFKTLEPASVPLQKSGPKRTIIMIVSAVIGAVLVAGIQLVRAFLSRNSALRS
ncbi:GNVR domain-containing protein [Spirosoma rhododendri]|uniref:Lipopolysaccharide biosynthesis protein n=1 Tax=Spirosoma rhododendri TaxID=2728024 RepID=A0A7L5DIZ0_9BACT|nr:GNVR domain-containing protein [Spirosoma rhododendri]QJD78364.1 lipopolysaccharide biosynthesis protein [Spirosoma rhododendri]